MKRLFGKASDIGIELVEILRQCVIVLAKFTFCPSQANHALAPLLHSAQY